MDGQKFDELIKQFCTTRLTRLSALRGLVAGVAATVTGSALIADDAEARKKGRGGAKAQDKKKGGGKKGGGKKGGDKKGGDKKGGDKKKGAGGQQTGGQQAQGDQPATNDGQVTAQAACNPVTHVLICHLAQGGTMYDTAPTVNRSAKRLPPIAATGPRLLGTVFARPQERPVRTSGTFQTCESISLDCNTATGFCAKDPGQCVVDSDCTPDKLPDDNNPCTVPHCTVTGGVGVCSHVPGNAGTVCRAKAGPCDVREVCDGTSADCPADQFEPSTTECRAKAGDCDVAEFCTGTSADCPPDGSTPARSAERRPDHATSGKSATAPGGLPGRSIRAEHHGVPCESRRL